MRISVIGNVGLDVVVSHVDSLAPPGTEKLVENATIRVGGSAGNTSMKLAALGVEHELHASLGDDATAAAVRVLLEDGGVDCSRLITTPGAPTAVTVATQSPRRDRSFLTAEGHLAFYDRACVPDDALDADFVLLTGYFTTPALHGDPTEDMLRRVRAHGGRTCFDPGSDPEGWQPATVATLHSLLPLVDVFLPNAQELSVLGGSDDPRTAATALHERSGGRVVAKLGPEGCLVAGPGPVVACRARPVPNPDTTGAGDAFNAGLLYGLVHRMPWPQAARTATDVATDAVARHRRAAERE
ncbi:carbohydrate kinase family protein [Amycolatopsis rubida]|uniref:Sugar or nucleoside kinase, ribokinase family n=1 Tax=Amycolatopsis rubida TaxID=112413 RepID=A0A1I5XJI1_9PSEU|nr:carbohydrate kinase family protein [Amycolatopsis rubida]SFQ32125.1 Sugar or nucleoside kinase, ribokinase family [Amycolatopsis rubida]